MLTGNESFLIATTELHDGASVTVSSEKTSMPGLNLLRPSPADPWVTDDLSNLSVTIDLDLQPGETWSFLAILYANFGTQCTWRAVAASTLDGLESPTFSTLAVQGQQSSVMSHRNHEWVHSFVYSEHAEWQSQGSRSERYVRLFPTIIDPKLPRNYVGDRFLQWGNVLISEPYRPPYSVEPGAVVSWESSPKRSRALGRGIRVEERRATRVAQYSVGFLTKQEAQDDVDEIDRRMGQHGHVMTIREPDDLERAHKESIYGVLDLSGRVNRKSDVYSKQIKIREVYA